MNRIYAILAALVAAVAAVVGAFSLGERRSRDKQVAEQAKSSLNAEVNRRKLDDEIKTDPDLAARARRVGIVRPRT